ANPKHTLRSAASGASSPQVPSVRPPLREALYTMGPSGPLFTSIASRETNSLISRKLPSAVTLPTSTGGTFSASSASIIPTNVANAVPRTLAEVSRAKATFPRKRGEFSDDALGKLQSTKWLNWGGNASFAPEWDDGGVGGGFGAEGIALDWAYKRLRRSKCAKAVETPMVVEVPPEVIDEKLLLEWEGLDPPGDLDGEVLVEEREMSVDETLDGLRSMILLLGQMQ